MARNTGFTLIELMVVVAVVAILAAIAYPSYAEQVRKGRRADAVSIIGDTQLRLERWRADNPSYAGVTAPPATRFYRFEISDQAATAFTITAVPINAQAGDRCGNLVLSFNAGTITKTGAQADCWN